MKFNKNSIGIKLWKYFVIFAMITLVLLWLLQTVFLQNFYDRMQLKSVKRAADEIAENMEAGRGAGDIGRIAYENSMQVILTDTDGDILYRADEYSPAYEGGESQENSRQSWQIGKYRNLPEGYASFLRDVLESKGGCVSYELTSDTGGRHFIFGKTVQCPEKMAVLYINTPVGAVLPTVQILKKMLFAVTGLLFFTGFVLAFFFARQFAKPVSELCVQAGKLAGGGGDIAFAKEFCSELDELSCPIRWKGRQKALPGWKIPAGSCLPISAMT